MGYSEFVDWFAYFDVEPFSGARGDLHAAQICAVLAEINRNRKKRRKPFKPVDFLVDWWADRRRAHRDAAEPPALLAKMQALTADWAQIAQMDPEDGSEEETYVKRHRDAGN